jgi:hypothetical protein
MSTSRHVPSCHFVSPRPNQEWRLIQTVRSRGLARNSKNGLLFMGFCC